MAASYLIGYLMEIKIPQQKNFKKKETNKRSGIETRSY